MSEPLELSPEQANALVFGILQKQGAIVERTGGEALWAAAKGFVSNSSKYKVAPSKITPELADAMTKVFSAMPGTSSSFTALYDIKKHLNLGNENLGLSQSDLEKAAHTVAAAMGSQGKISEMLAQAEKNFKSALAGLKPQSPVTQYASELVKGGQNFVQASVQQRIARAIETGSTGNSLRGHLLENYKTCDQTTNEIGALTPEKTPSSAQHLNPSCGR